MRFYRYRYAGWNEKRASGATWDRQLLGDYLQPVSLDTLKQL